MNDQNNKEKMNLCKCLNDLTASDRYPFHMPGHKRQSLNETDADSENRKRDGQIEMSAEKLLQTASRFDITEIEGFDDLHHPMGVIREEQQRAARLFGAKESYYLVNGSTAGILAAICSQTKHEEGIILARNSHRSAYHAVYLNGPKVCYLYPRQISLQELFHISTADQDKIGMSVKDTIPGPIDPQDVGRAMEESGYKVVCITSPSYEGIVSDISAIAEQVHSRGGILIVDEAHGAHLSAFQTICERYKTENRGDEAGIQENTIDEIVSSFPKSAVRSGADIVIESLHKTLPSLTQTAILHVCSDRVDLQQLKYSLDIFQTSSPSYLLMASISECVTVMEEKGTELLIRYNELLSEFYRGLAELMYLHLITPHQIKRAIAKQEGKDADEISMQYMDPSKLVIYVPQGCVKEGKPYRGPQLAAELLETYQLDMEMTAPGYVLAMTSVMDSPEGVQRLLKALFEIDGKLLMEKSTDQKTADRQTDHVTAAMSVMTIRRAMDSDLEMIPLQESVGRTAAEFVYRYPPGIPVVAPGEVITKEAVEEIVSDENAGFTLHRQGVGILVVRRG